MKLSLSELENSREFIERHIAISKDDEAALCQFLGFKDRTALIDAVVQILCRWKAFQGQKVR
jgi:glycine cleavage system pyridoxal-binding protein P